VSGCLVDGCGGCVCGAQSCSSDNADAVRYKNDLKVCETKLNMAGASSKQTIQTVNNNGESKNDPVVDEAKEELKEFSYRYLITPYAATTADKFYADNLQFNEGFVSFQDKEMNTKYWLGGSLMIKEVNRRAGVTTKEKKDEEDEY